MIGAITCFLVSVRCHWIKVWHTEGSGYYAQFYMSESLGCVTVIQDTYKDEEDPALTYGLLPRDADELR